MSNQEIITSAEYQSRYGKKLFPTKVPSLKGRPKMSDNPVRDSIEFGEGWCKITLAGLSPGLNTKNGLAHQHWSQGEKLKKEYMWRIAALKPTKFTVPVIIDYKRFCIQKMDFDNMVSSWKKLGDALKLNGIIVNDSTEWLKLVPDQEKCKRKDIRMEVTIKPL